MKTADIEWVKNPDGTKGFTCNPQTGCLNHTDGKCKGGNFPCYAWGLATTRLRERYLDNATLPDHDAKVITLAHTQHHLDPFYPRFWPEKLDQIKRRKKPAGIFLSNMGDLFGQGIPEQWTRDVLDVIRECPQHRFYLLTKQSQNLAKFPPFPENCWVGQTLTNQGDADRTFSDFAKVEATVKYLSLEPLLGKVDVSPYLKGWVNAGTIFENPEGIERYDVDGALVNHIDWIIIGACTGTFQEMADLSGCYPEISVIRYGNQWTAQPKIEWVQQIVGAADQAGIPVFLKNNLFSLITQAAYRNEVDDSYILEGKLRQEMPA